MSLSDMDMDLIMTLDALLRDQNITHAAARLGISQPAMSARLARLRVLFDEPLFIPSPHAELQNQISSAAPGIRLRFALPETQLLPAQMENGDVDIYVGVNAGAHDAWVRRKLFDDEYATAQRKGHPRGTGPMDLESYCSLSHLVVSSEGDPFAGFVDQHLAGLGHQRNVVMSTQSYAMAPAIVAGTDLLCTLPRRMLLRFTQTLDIFPPPLDLPPIVIGMYWHPKNSQDPANRWLREQLLQAAGRQV